MAAYPPIRFHLLCRVRRSRRRLECLKARGVLITNAPTLCVTCRPVRCLVLLVVLLGNLTNALSALRAAAGTYTPHTPNHPHHPHSLCALLVAWQSAKAELYRRFSHVLLLLIVVSGMWVTSQLLVILSDGLDTRWAMLWTFEAGWHVLFFLCLLTICVLWSPSKNNLQYAYMEMLVAEEDGGDGAEDGPR